MQPPPSMMHPSQGMAPFGASPYGAPPPFGMPPPGYPPSAGFQHAFAPSPWPIPQPGVSMQHHPMMMPPQQMMTSMASPVVMNPAVSAQNVPVATPVVMTSSSTLSATTAAIVEPTAEKAPTHVNVIIFYKKIYSKLNG